MVNVRKESTFAEVLMAAQMQFKTKEGRYPNVEENNELIEQLEKGGDFE